MKIILKGATSVRRIANIIQTGLLKTHSSSFTQNMDANSHYWISQCRTGRDAQTCFKSTEIRLV